MWRSSFAASGGEGDLTRGYAVIDTDVRRRSDLFLEAFLKYFAPCASWPHEDFLTPATYHTVDPGPVHPRGTVWGMTSCIALAVAIDETRLRRQWYGFRAAWAAAVIGGIRRRTGV